MQATYTLNVQAERPNAAEQIAAANETDAQTEAKNRESKEAQTETETETEAVSDAANAVLQKVDKIKSDADFFHKSDLRSGGSVGSSDLSGDQPDPEKP